MNKQLILIADMEGTSGIFEGDGQALFHGSPRWREYGRDCITSDVLAVCEAALECGIDEIMLYDGHFAGSPEHNIILEKLPSSVRVFDVVDRCFDWRRIRGQASVEPFGLITVGQHARYGEPNAYFAHTIQSPPIQGLYVNGMHIAEIGTGALTFLGTRYIANIGCAASHTEAREISDTVYCITVKDKANAYEPTPSETFGIIKQGVKEAISGIDTKRKIEIGEPCLFTMELCDGFAFRAPAAFSWKGSFENRCAYWHAPDIAMGLELFNYVRNCIERRDE